MLCELHISADCTWREDKAVGETVRMPKFWPICIYGMEGKREDQTRLRIIAKLVVEALPGALIWVCNGNVVCVRQGLHTLPHQWDAALKQWQDCVAKVEALLHIAQCVLKLPACNVATQCYHTLTSQSPCAYLWNPFRRIAT